MDCENFLKRGQGSYVDPMVDIYAQPIWTCSQLWSPNNVKINSRTEGNWAVPQEDNMKEALERNWKNCTPTHSSEDEREMQLFGLCRLQEQNLIGNNPSVVSDGVFEFKEDSTQKVTPVSFIRHVVKPGTTWMRKEVCKDPAMHSQTLSL